MTEQEADLSLVKLVKSGDKQAFNLLVSKYQYKLLSAVRTLVSESDSYDVVQETFIKAYKSLDSFREESAFFTWLYRIAINTAKNHLTSLIRKKDCDVDVGDAEVVNLNSNLHETDTPEGILEKNETKRIILKTINSLPIELKQALVLREVEEMSYEDIAKVLKCPVGTVRSRIFRARNIVEEAISV